MHASRITAHRQQREQQEQRDRDQVVAEFGADPQRLADEILCLRRGLKVVAEAAGLARQGAPVALVRPGPSWRPRAAGVSSLESDGGENRQCPPIC
jgi:hypothetical protein